VWTVVSMTTVVTWHTRTARFLGWLRTTTGQQTSDKTIVGVCQFRKTAFEHRLYLFNFWYCKTFSYSDRNTVSL